MGIQKLFAALVVTGSLADSALAQELRVTTSEPLALGMTYTLESDVLSEERTIHVAVPPDYASSAKRYPVVYVLDAQNFPLFQYAYGEAAALAGMDDMPEVILVGVTSEDRARDMTVASPTNDGRADAFIDFFANELQGFIDARFRTEPYTILVGHSLGAAFALHSLFQRPGTFDAYIAISPALWFDDGRIFHEIKEQVAANAQYRNALFTSLANEDGDMQQYYEDLLELLAETQPAGLEFAQKRFPEENHGSTTLPGIHHGFLSLYPRWTPPDDIASFDALKAYYAELSEHYGYPIAIHPEAASNVGFNLYDAGDAAGALEIFEYSLANLAQRPTEYHQMGLALRELGRLEEALAAFETAVATGAQLPFYQMFVEDRDDVAQRLKR